MRRREFIAGLWSLAAWPFEARAQQPKLPVIGLLSGFAAGSPLLANFYRGLKEAGFFDGQNVSIDYRSADGDYERLPELAADLINKRVTVITTLGERAALAVKAARTARNSKIPFVFSLGEDPVALGLVPSLNRGADNITGVTSITQSLELKRLEALREFVPDARLIAVLINPNVSREFELKNVEEMARVLGLQLLIIRANAADQFDSAFSAMARERAGALLIIAETYLTSQSDRLGSLALRYAIPAIFTSRDFVAAGGLMSYGSSIPDTIRQAGVYTGKILAGIEPADLPVMQPTKFEFIINLSTAKKLGLNVPTSIQLRADEVIE
jgi:putative tryptophan/tyrosine transport system substrate-binding protein